MPHGKWCFFVQGNTDKTSAPANTSRTDRQDSDVFFITADISLTGARKKTVKPRGRSVSSRPSERLLSASPSWRLWMLTVFAEEEEEAGFNVLPWQCCSLCRCLSPVLTIRGRFKTAADHTVQILLHVSIPGPDITHTAQTHSHNKDEFTS